MSSGLIIPSTATLRQKMCPALLRLLPTTMLSHTVFDNNTNTVWSGKSESTTQLLQIRCHWNVGSVLHLYSLTNCCQFWGILLKKEEHGSKWILTKNTTKRYEKRYAGLFSPLIFCKKIECRNWVPELYNSNFKEICQLRNWLLFGSTPIVCFRWLWLFWLKEW